MTNTDNLHKNQTSSLKRILVVSHFFSAHGGGIELVIHRLLREMGQDSRLRFSWAASNCDPAPNDLELTTLPMRSWNLLENTIGVPWPLWSLGSLRTLFKAVGDADTLWIHDSLYFGQILAFFYARLKKKRIVITQHIAPVPYRNPILRLLMRLADGLFTAQMMQKADEVTFISDRVAEDYYRRIPFVRPIRVIPNGVDVRLFHVPIPENRRFLRQQFALKNDQPVMLFVGRFVERKGLDVLRRLAALLPEWRFWLAGDGPIDPGQWLMPNVHVFRGRKGESLADLYKAADLLLIPSYGEGFPLVIQEAMACGLPVLCGPSTAQGNLAAQPFLHVADVWPENSERTAAVWYERLTAFSRPLPLVAPLEDIADFALRSWDWKPIAAVYADLLKHAGEPHAT